MLFDITNKKVLITGSTSGIGYVLAEGVAKEGAVVIINGRNAEKVNNAVKGLKDKGLNVFGYTFDISKPEEVEKSVALIEKELGNIDVLVNNAGIQIRGKLEEFELDDWNKVIETNLTGAFVVSKYVVKGMIRRRKGKIVNICSLQSELARNTIAPYAAAKGGMKMLTRSMATEWAKHNVQVNGIGPGYFKTAITKALYENTEFNDWLCNRTPVGRWGNPEELVGTLVYLSSEASDFVNGQLIFVDGGITACI
jgi:gluconate 5-dehydrogenase